MTNFGHVSCTRYCRKPLVKACRNVLELFIYSEAIRSLDSRNSKCLMMLIRDTQLHDITSITVFNKRAAKCRDTLFAAHLASVDSKECSTV